METREQAIKEIKAKVHTVLDAVTVFETALNEAIQFIEQHEELAQTLYKDDEEVKLFVNIIEKTFNRL